MIDGFSDATQAAQRLTEVGLDDVRTIETLVRPWEVVESKYGGVLPAPASVVPEGWEAGGLASDGGMTKRRRAAPASAPAGGAPPLVPTPNHDAWAVMPELSARGHTAYLTFAWLWRVPKLEELQGETPTPEVCV